MLRLIVAHTSLENRLASGSPKQLAKETIHSLCLHSGVLQRAPCRFGPGFSCILIMGLLSAQFLPSSFSYRCICPESTPQRTFEPLYPILHLSLFPGHCLFIPVVTLEENCLSSSCYQHPLELLLLFFLHPVLLF